MSFALYCFSPYQNALPTQGLSSTHLLSLDALLAIVRNFQTWQATGQDSSFTSEPQSMSHVKVGGENIHESHNLSPGFTQINSAGIIFTTSAENVPLEVSALTMSTVRSESALMSHVGIESQRIQEALRMEEHVGARNITKAASGYMMAIKGTEEELLLEAPPFNLPTPKELIEIRQKKKVH